MHIFFTARALEVFPCMVPATVSSSNVNRNAGVEALVIVGMAGSRSSYIPVLPFPEI